MAQDIVYLHKVSLGWSLTRNNKNVRTCPVATSPGAAGIVLARDGPMMLLGYASQPRWAFVRTS